MTMYFPDSRDGFLTGSDNEGFMSDETLLENPKGYINSYPKAKNRRFRRKRKNLNDETTLSSVTTNVLQDYGSAPTIS